MKFYADTEKNKMTLQTLMQKAPMMYCYMKCWICYYIVLIVYIHVCHNTQDNFWKSVLPVFGSHEQNSGCQAWWLVSTLSGWIISQALLLVWFLFICFSETGLHSSPDLDLNSQRSTYPRLRCAGIQGMCHHTCYYLLLKKVNMNQKQK